MVKDPKTRIQKWLKNYHEPNSKKRQYVTSQVAYEFNLQAKLERTIKEILNKTNIPTIFNIPYLNFARKLLSLKRHYLNHQLKTEINFIMTKALHQGLDKKVLKKIQKAVMSIET
jgi:hypothetical protein